VYHSTAIRDLFAEKEDTELVTEEDCRMALVFIALLRGGDYSPSGFEGIGEFRNC
jgi:Holliday junction resolvase YEN1